MTAVNLIASAVYTRGFQFKEKVQLYIMALLFLVLLYTSPAGLVFYWTLNNVFSLVKNCVYKTKKPLRTAYLIFLVSILALTGVYVTKFNLSRIKTLFMEAVCAAVILIPFAIRLAKKLAGNRGSSIGETRSSARLFWLSCLAFAAFAGLALPGALISSSTVEFSAALGNRNPLGLLGLTVSQALGLFVFWPGCLYLLFSGKTRRTLAVIASASLFAGMADAWLFRGHYGTISSFLIFDNSDALKAGLAQAGASLAALAAIVAAVVFLSGEKRIRFLTPVTGIVLAALVAASVPEIPKIAREYGAYMATNPGSGERAKLEPVYHFSKTGNNVCVIMLDRAIGSYVPDVFAEDPALNASFAGFVWYPNTASFGPNTIIAAPALFGGYEYTPDAIDARADEPLVKKHNEALCAMPRFFAEAGWKTTITDMSWANYSWVPDNGIFKPWPAITATNLAGAYTAKWLDDHDLSAGISNRARLERNVLCFSLFRIMPMPARWFFYHEGDYWMPSLASSKAFKFVEKFAALDYLAGLSDFGCADNSFNIIVNDATHEPVFLQYPDYAIKEPVTDRGPDRFGNESAWKMYHSNAAALRALGRFFDAMKAAGVYDNTRIIIASDHGSDGVARKDKSAFPEYFADKSFNPATYNPLLLVKDFGTSGALATDRRFMTNADVPDLATGNGLFPAAANPFSGKPFAAGDRKNFVDIFPSNEAVPERHGKNAFLPDGKTAARRVHDDLYVESNWEKR